MKKTICKNFKNLKNRQMNKIKNQSRNIKFK